MVEHVCDQTHFHVVIRSRLGYAGPSVATILDTGQVVRVESAQGEDMLARVFRGACEAIQAETWHSQTQEFAKAWHRACADAHGGAWTTSVPGYPGILLHCCEIFSTGGDT